MMKRIFKILSFLLIPITLSGQSYPLTSQYVINPISINPAYTGVRGALNIAALYRKQWTGITGAPETMTLTSDAAVMDNKLGLGLIITNDKIGVTKETHFSITYSYKIEMKEGLLSFGLGTGLFTTNTKWSDLVVLDPGDEYYLADSRVYVVPDFSFGTYYSYKNFFAGFSIPRLLGYEFNYNTNKYSINVNPAHYNYLLSTGYSFALANKLRLLPSVLLNYRPGEKPSFDINAHVSYADRLWFGFSYRNTGSLVTLLQVSLNKQLKLAYTYDFDFGQLGKFSNGSHEIMIRYEFRYKVNVVNPLVF
jgi:type IX secretion system PorP/SprF family membrane protein